MRVFAVATDAFDELEGMPAHGPEHGFLWVGCSRSAFETQLAGVQEALQRWAGSPVVDLHVSDLLNAQLPSHFEDTPWYDLMVFRRLASTLAAAPGTAAPTRGKEARATANGLTEIPWIDTSPVGFVVFDRVLLTVHPEDCAVRDHFAQRLAAQAVGGDARGATRLPGTPADLMLRMVNHMVDGYLELRRLLTRQLVGLQQDLLNPRNRFQEWELLLQARNQLHWLEDTCEDQRSAVQEWIDVLEESPVADSADAGRERDLLRVRSRDVLEHIERVLAHVRRLEQSSENAVQMHFSAIGHRTNDIMRTLTVLTAIFMPLNLITGFFGMNFEYLPLIHTSSGLWIAMGLMAALGLGLWLFFQRKRYLP